MIIPILDPEDSRIEPYCNVRERDLVGRQGRFIAEGEVVLNVLLKSAYRVESMLVSHKQLAFAQQARPLLPAATPIFCAEQDVMDAITGFHIHRGLLAIGLRGTEPPAEALLASLPENALVLGLVGLSNHDNIGGVFRNAAAFGADAVILDGLCCDPLYRKALRVSVGGVLKAPFARIPTAQEMIAALRHAGFAILALSPRGKHDLRSFVPRGRTALLLGAEGPGLPDDILDCLETASISMSNAFDSLNVATTSGIALYQMQTSPAESG